MIKGVALYSVTRMGEGEVPEEYKNYFDETFDAGWDNVLPEIPEPVFLIVGHDEAFDSDWWDT